MIPVHAVKWKWNPRNICYVVRYLWHQIYGDDASDIIASSDGNHAIHKRFRDISLERGASKYSEVESFPHSIHAHPRRHYDVQEIDDAGTKHFIFYDMLRGNPVNIIERRHTNNCRVT